MIRFIAILFACLLAGIGTAADVIPLSRRTDWKNYVGVSNLMVNATQTVSSAMTVYTNLATNVTTTALQNALNNCPSNKVVQLTNGTYTITARFQVPVGRVLRGTGQYVSETQGTRLATSSGFTDVGVLMIDNGYPMESSLDITAGEVNLTNVVQNSLSVTTMQAHGLSVGDIVLMDQKTNHSVPVIASTETYVGRDAGTRPNGHWAEVTSVINSTAVNITPPVIIALSNVNTPKLIKVANWVKRTGVESLTIDTLATSGSNAKYVIQLQGAMDYWFYDVEIKGIYDRGVWGYGSFRGTWQKCYFHGNRPIGADYDTQYQSQRAYGMYMGPHNTSVAILDCTFNKLTLAVAWEGNSSGNAMAYNFVTNMWWFSTGAGESKINFGPLMHGPCPSYNLIEGNFIEGRWRSDALFGSSFAFTIHRNRIWPRDRRDGSRTIYQQWFAVEVEKWNHWYNFTQNVIGSGNEVTYERNGTTFQDYGSSSPTADRVIWKNGYAYNSQSSTGHDTNVQNSMIRWGNWDTLSSATKNHVPTYAGYDGDTNSPSTVTSYLYDSKPVWFGNRTWPPVDPSSPNNDAITNIPAAARFIGIDIYSETGGGPDLTFPRGTPKIRGIKIKG